MTLFEAKPYDVARARKKRDIILAAIVAVIVIGVVLWMFRYWPEERVVNQFFAALEQQHFEQAYGVWMHDAEWKQHTDRYSSYTYNDFIKDWGPGGEWGIIKSFHVDGAAVPHGYSGSPFATASGVVVVVTVNERIADKAHIWVQKDDKTLGFSPF
ncbi:MAG TPA: hypothetical protein VK976_10000 [Verrucomicrobiae bacterium]|jgi:hypothetical protein|nr:hypothetical protein [Verrucomicrobiae bacterium]